MDVVVIVVVVKLFIVWMMLLLTFLSVCECARVLQTLDASAVHFFLVVSLCRLVQLYFGFSCIGLHALFERKST